MQQRSICSYKAMDQDYGLYASHQQLRLPSLVDLPSIDLIGRQKYPVASTQALISIIVVPSSEHCKAKYLAAATYRMLKKDKIDKVIIVAQSNYLMFHGIALPINRSDTDLFGDFMMNSVHVEQLALHPLFHYHESAYRKTPDFHAQLKFMQHYLHDTIEITPLLVGQITHENAVDIAAQVALLCDDRTLIIVSTDVAFRDEFVSRDMSCQSIESTIYDADAHIIQAIQGIPTGATDIQIDCLCQKNALILLLKILEQANFSDIQSCFVGYDTSFDLADSSYQDPIESYAAFIFQQGDQPAYKNNIGLYEQSQLIHIAQSSLLSVFEPAILQKPRMISYEMMQPHGAFVSLYAMTDHGTLLRGCMGLVQSQVPLYSIVADMAQNAACHDHRFYILTHQEVKSTLISISIVTDLRQVFNHAEIRHTDGVWFRYDDKSAISLPSATPIHNWNYSEMLTDLCFQVGVTLHAWREPQAKIFMFQSLTFQEA